MKVFVTGASGWIGSAVVPALIEAGHEVVGLARSDASAATVSALGAEVTRGSLEDTDVLRDAAGQSDGVVHLGYNHDFSQMADAADLDRRSIEVFADVLAGTDGPLLIASGLLGLRAGGVASEDDMPDPASHPRSATGAYVLGLAERGIRSGVVRFAPTVHGPGDRGFIAVLAELARRTGVSGYVDDGANRWSAVHRLDAADLIRRGLEATAPGSVLHATAEDGIATRQIAEAIGAALGVPTRSVPADEVDGHFGWIGRFFGVDCAASSVLTRERLDWTPTHDGLLDDLAAGHYNDADPHSPAGG